MIGQFCGFKIIEMATLPERALVTRRWKERLFTKPWRPWIREKYLPLADNVERNKSIYRMGDKIYATAQVISQIKEQVKQRRR